MTGLDPTLEDQLRRVSRRWRWLRFWELLGALGIAWLASCLLLGVCMWRGWIRHPALAAVIVVAPVLLGGGGLVVLAAFAAASSRPRSWLAQALENVHRPFLDRLNTLVFIEGVRGDPVLGAYFRRIEAQARRALRPDLVPTPLSGRTSARRWAVCLALFLGTFIFYARFEPWSGLGFPEGRAESGRPPDPEPKLPEPESAEVKAAWGEVRITEPGRDLKVTKVDVVPLQIEAAASEPLKKALWFTTTAGSEAKPHTLPPPGEPHYAVYQPLLYVDEFRLSDWDVLTYYASASTSAGRSYASEIYFVEIRPFREDILKLPGGEGGRAYRALSELTGLIDRQKHVIRETHGHLQRAYDSAVVKQQDQKKLAEAETDLRDAARHLYAKIAASMENQDVGVVLDHLARADEALGRASRALSGDAREAPVPEQEALTELVATRKRLQKALTDDPNALGDEGEPDAEERSPVADMPDKLKRVAEFRNEEKAAREALDKAVEGQRKIMERTESGDRSSYPSLAEEQKELRRSLDELAATHPRVFKGSEGEKREADAALARATDALEKTAPAAPAEQKRALEKLEELRKAVGGQIEGRQLAHAYRLKELLDEHAKELARIESDPGSVDERQAQEQASAARETTRELKSVVGETSAGDAFGPALKEALSDEAQRARERKLDALAQARDAEARKRAAASGKESLQELSQAFDKSAPAVVRDLRKSDPLKPSAEEALERALRQLEGMAAAGKRAASPEDEAKQRKEALANLREGAEVLYGKNERTNRLLLRVEEELAKAEEKVDGPRLRKLLEEIERFRVEMNDARLAKGESLDVRHIDASKLPPAYRERIQRYFQKLSEQ